ncbi:SH3 domain-containing protein [Thiovibrio frasassiensis]|uniref:SH3 domain-containing protein n=1 Tax=Thiovibrio frasassiensis TaxID=2984131 RepID=A0A9X4MFN7_9BACT|nr:SH3 domain-containing protein [Thiovibrio frasassiensis]MDG4475075.1 SH3 domain-containing protein [Thiovibrio frasassiensis]
MGMRKQILLFLVFALAAVPALATQGWRSVAVQKGAVRISPMPFGKIIATLGYGERVDVLEEQGLWLKVREQHRGREGWMHSGSLIAKAIVLKPGERVGAGASEDELALGGKGFNAQVEAEYKARQKDLNYAAVDWMERIQVTPAAMREFLAKGGLQALGGGGAHGK